MHEAQPHGVVLVVEDDPALRGMVVEFLKASGYEILEAADGEAGLDLATRHVPDVILLDLALPERTGEDVLRALKEDERTRHIPVLVISGYTRLLRQAEAERAAALLDKPFDPDELLAKVGHALAGRARPE